LELEEAAVQLLAEPPGSGVRSGSGVSAADGCARITEPNLMTSRQVLATTRNGRRYLCALLLLVAMTGSAKPALAAGGDVAVIVRPETPVDNLSLSEVRKLFLGDRQFWTGNLRVTLLIRAPTSHERDVVLKIIYRMSEPQFRQYWISKVFRAEASSGPKIVYSSSMASELVLAIPGSVAFVDATQVPKGLRVVKIEGTLPGDSAYPLK
jgi:hypothetical protein